MRFELADGETVLRQSVAALSREKMIDGELCLSNYRLRFRAMNQADHWSHGLEELASVTSKRGHIVVEIDDGRQETIVLYNQEEWTKQILSAKARWVPPPTSEATRPEAPVDSPRSALLGKLMNSFDVEELRSLCFDIDVEFENLPGESKEAKIRELILSCERTGTLGDLLDRCHELRPNASWPTITNWS